MKSKLDIFGIKHLVQIPMDVEQTEGEKNKNLWANHKMKKNKRNGELKHKQMKKQDINWQIIKQHHHYHCCTNSKCIYYKLKPD